MKDEYERSGQAARGRRVRYAAQSWPHERRVITRLEWGEQGNNPRYVVTNLDGKPQALYDDLYCQRGEAENRIKEAQVGLFATRTSCHHFQSNQLRMLLAALGYVLIERLRALALQGTALANAQVDTLRIKLLKVAAVVTRNTRRIRLYLASNWPSARDLCARHEPAALTLNSIQCLARALTPKRPATQAGVGVPQVDVRISATLEVLDLQRSAIDVSVRLTTLDKGLGRPSVRGAGVAGVCPAAVARPLEAAGSGRPIWPTTRCWPSTPRGGSR
jgi:hypothetical protein